MELFQPDTRQESKSLWLLTNSQIQSRYTQVGELSLKPQETEHSNPLSLSPLHVKWMWGYHDMKNVYSLAPITQALIWLRHCGNQASSWLCVCVRKGEDLHQGRASLLNSVCWNKSCISSGARQQTLAEPAVCHSALLHSTRRLLPWLLSDAQRSAPCFHNSSGTDGWHSCSVGPYGLLKKGNKSI